MKHVLAISGGVDSVALLDMVAKQLLQGLPLQDCVVAHFDHGVRAESGRDAEFVRGLAKEYGLPFKLGNAKLGPKASEETARKKRYEFLRSVASSEPAAIVTAHHQDDLIETILINLIRGTGWRGLAPFWSDDIMRPLLGQTKAELVEYAIKNDLEWVEDETNYSPKYLRNRVRFLAQKISPQQRKSLLNLHGVQTEIRTEIENTLKHILHGKGTVPNLEKDVIIKIPDTVAIEILRKWTSEKLTTPQLNRLLGFIKTGKSGDIFHAGAKLRVANYKGCISLSDLT